MTQSPPGQAIIILTEVYISDPEIMKETKRWKLQQYRTHLNYQFRKFHVRGKKMSDPDEKNNWREENVITKKSNQEKLNLNMLTKEIFSNVKYYQFSTGVKLVIDKIGNSLRIQK